MHFCGLMWMNILFKAVNIKDGEGDIWFYKYLVTNVHDFYVTVQQICPLLHVFLINLKEVLLNTYIKIVLNVSLNQNNARKSRIPLIFPQYSGSRTRACRTVSMK